MSTKGFTTGAPSGDAAATVVTPDSANNSQTDAARTAADAVKSAADAAKGAADAVKN